MQKGFGIAALVLAIVSIFVPVLGPWLTILAGALAAMSYGTGFALGLSAIIINVINIFVLSPTVWLAMAAGAVAASVGKSWMSVGTILFVAQAASLVVLVTLHAKKKVPNAS